MRSAQASRSREPCSSRPHLLGAGAQVNAPSAPAGTPQPSRVKTKRRRVLPSLVSLFFKSDSFHSPQHPRGRPPAAPPAPPGQRLSCPVPSLPRVVLTPPRTPTPCWTAGWTACAPCTGWTSSPSSSTSPSTRRRRRNSSRCAPGGGRRAAGSGRRAVPLAGAPSRGPWCLSDGVSCSVPGQLPRNFGVQVALPPPPP